MQNIKSIELNIKFEQELNLLKNTWHGNNERENLLYISNSYIYEKLFEKKLLLKEDEQYVHQLIVSVSTKKSDKHYYIELCFIPSDEHFVLIYNFKSPYLAGLFLINEYKNYMNMLKTCSNPGFCIDDVTTLIKQQAKDLMFKCRTKDRDNKSKIMWTRYFYLTVTDKSEYYI